MRAVVLLCLLHAALAQTTTRNPFGWSGPKTAATNANGATTLSLSNGATTIRPYRWVASKNGAPTQSLSSAIACNTNPQFCGCCVMEKEVNMMKTHFNKTLTELEKEYDKINQSLDVVKDRRVAFSASLYEMTTRCYGEFQVDTVIKYEHVILNQGESYNVSTGVFTVPYSGVYVLTVTVYSDSGSDQQKLKACASLQVNGTEIARAKDKNDYDQEDSATIVVARHLVVGDQVSVFLIAGCSLCDNDRYNTFSVFLLYATH